MGVWILEIWRRGKRFRRWFLSAQTFFKLSRRHATVWHEPLTCAEIAESSSARRCFQLQRRRVSVWRTGPGRKCKTAWIAVTWRSRSQGAPESLVLKITSALCFFADQIFWRTLGRNEVVLKGVGTVWPLSTLFVDQSYFWSSVLFLPFRFYF